MKYKMICSFKLVADMFGGVCERHELTSIPGKGADGIGCGWEPIGQSLQPCLWTGAHLHVLKTSDPFLQCTIKYIFFTLELVH